MKLEEQIDRLVALGYHQILECSLDGFNRSLLGLQKYVPAHPFLDLQGGTISFALVVGTAALPAGRTLPMIVRDGHAAVEKLYPRSPEFFRPRAEVAIPSGHAYLLIDVDRGNDTRNAVPLFALEQLAASGRSPLTMEEGIAVLTQKPQFLQPNHCFMLLGSRGDDKRVPALWLSGKQPKLGWCWEGNPHTWLGFASCGARSPGVLIEAADARRR